MCVCVLITFVFEFHITIDLEIGEDSGTTLNVQTVQTREKSRNGTVNGEIHIH